MPAARREGAPIADSELTELLSDLARHRVVLLAVSGGPDSTALLHLAHRWRKPRRDGPILHAATVDHGLRRESAAEARAVARQAKSLGIRHHTLLWRGKKPATGLQAAARAARYELLAQLAAKLGADAIVTAHTRDDQAETVLMRLARGSGLAGLAGMRARSGRNGIAMLRPLLDVPKARLLATLKRRRIAFADDPSNLDPRFTRVRWRKLADELAREGLGPERIAVLARRAARANAALNGAAQSLRADSTVQSAADTAVFDGERLFRAPEEITLRVIGDAIARIGDEGPVELAKLEALHDAFRAAAVAGRALRRTLAGAVVGLKAGRLGVERAPARRRGKPRRAGTSSRSDS